jgi:hypothetical protein
LDLHLGLLNAKLGDLQTAGQPDRNLLLTLA